MIRLHVSQPLGTGRTVAASAEQHRYLTGVMRLGVGDAVRLFNGTASPTLRRMTPVR